MIEEEIRADDPRFDEQSAASAAKKTSQTWKKILEVCVALAGTVILLSIVLKNVDWLSFMDALKDIQFDYVLFALTGFLASMIFMSIKFYMAYPDGGFWFVFRSLMLSNFFYILPAGAVLGTGSIIALLHQEGNIYRISSVVIFDNVTKFFSLVFCFWLGTLISSVSIPIGIHVLAWCLMAVMTLLIAGLLFQKTRRALLRLSEKCAHYRWGKQLRSLLQDFAHVTDDMKKHPLRLALHMLFGVLAEALLVLPYIVLSQPLGIAIAANNWLWINGIIRIVASVPFAIGGLGAREGALTLLLGWLGVSSGVTLTLSLLYSVLNIISSLSSALFLIGRKPGKLLDFVRPDNAPNPSK